MLTVYVLVYSQVETFLRSSTLSPNSMAIDPYTRYMYWSDAFNNLINVTTLDKKEIGVIYQSTVDKPTDLAINALRG